MAAIHTVLGEVDPAQLGVCLPHEHVLSDFTPASGGPADLVLNDIELAVDELAWFRAAGGRAVVDVTTPDIGRNPAGLAQVAERTGLHVVMGTGWYRRLYYPDHLDRTPTQALAEAMTAELTEGAAGVRAGIIGEIGVDKNVVTAVEERVLRAAAKAHRATGAPISLHSSIHPVGLLQLDLLEEEGVDPAAVVVGHADTVLDPGYHRAVLARGAWLQFDTAGRNHMNPDVRRAAALAALVHEGHLPRLLVSSDRCYRSDLVAFGGAGYAHTITTFAAELAGHGLEPEELQEMTEANPARMLTW